MSRWFATWLVAWLSMACPQRAPYGWAKLRCHHWQVTNSGKRLILLVNKRLGRREAWSWNRWIWYHSIILNHELRSTQIPCWFDWLLDRAPLRYGRDEMTSPKTVVASCSFIIPWSVGAAIANSNTLMLDSLWELPFTCSHFMLPALFSYDTSRLVSGSYHIISMSILLIIWGVLIMILTCRIGTHCTIHGHAGE